MLDQRLVVENEVIVCGVEKQWRGSGWKSRLALVRRQRKIDFVCLKESVHTLSYSMDKARVKYWK